MELKFNQLVNKIINIIYSLLLLIGIIGASNRLLLVFNEELNNQGMLIIDLVIIVSFILFKLRKKLPMKYLVAFLGIALVIWQVYTVLTCSGFSIWDPGIIMLTATGHSNEVWVNFNQYFSTNPNTIPLLLIEHSLWILFNKPGIILFTKILGCLNIVLIDSALIFINIAIRKMFKSTTISEVATLFGVILMGISPWICIIYSDNIAFFLAALELLLISLWRNSSNRRKICLSAGLGVIAITDLLIKPSAIIFFIGVAVLIVFNIIKIKFNKKILFYAISFMIPFLLIGTGYKLASDNNSMVKINKSEALPLSHFVAMGIKNNGGYSLEDVNIDNSIKNPEQRNEAAQKRWRERYHQMGGFLGYERFLVNKQSINFAMGSMDWGGDGLFLKTFDQSKKIKNTLPRQLCTSKDGIAHKYSTTYFIIIQSAWCLGLILMLFAVFDKSLAIELLKIVFIGFCLFLLLFESGRSRYLIQFLPIMLSLMGIGYKKAKMVFSYLKK